MKKFYKVISLFIVFFVSFFGLTFKAEEVPIKDYDGEGYLIYDGTDEPLTINSEYNFEEKQFRGLWVSNFAGDVSSYSTEAAFKKEMTTLLDTMEYYHLNALIFHVRTHNNALYDSKLNARASFWSRVKFDQFDPLEWLISETHKRGIEFHAWMNPYRVKNSSNSYISGSDPQSNPASDPDNLLVCSSVTILDPGKENVKSFLISTVLEFINKYDVDAIHFDDYFYAEGCNDDKTYNENNPNGLNKADWRRENVNDFIRRLSVQIKSFNLRNNKSVQLGISPPGGWKNGNGKVTYDNNGHAITTGTLGNGFTSYDDYLYADSKAWVDNEWLDYICPQCYHDIQSGHFAETTDWWNKVVKYSDTNLYIGIGFYGPSNSWKDPEELKNELYWLNKLENVKGFAIYAYSALKKAYTGSNSLKKGQIDRVYRNILSKPTNLPTLRRYEFNKPQISEVLLTSDNSNFTFRFNNVLDAKYYLVYKDTTDISNLITRTWGEVSDNEVVLTVNEDCESNFIIVPVGFDNRLGEETIISKDDIKYKVTFTSSGKILKEYYVKSGETLEPVFDIDYSIYDVEYSSSYTNVTSNMTIEVTFIKKIEYVTVKYLDGDTYKEMEVEKTTDFESEALKLVPIVTGKRASGLIETSPDYYEVVYTDLVYSVTFLDFDGNVISLQEVKYNEKPIYPNLIEDERFIFLGWDYLGSITNDIVIWPLVEKNIKVTLVNYNNEVIRVDYYKKGEVLNLRTLLDVDFDGVYVYFIDKKMINDDITLESDLVIECHKSVAMNCEPIKKKGCKAGAISYYYLIGLLGVLVIFRRRKEI